MSREELRKGKEQILAEYKKTSAYGLSKAGGERGFHLFSHIFKDNADEIEAAIVAISGVISDSGMSLDEYREERLKKYEVSQSSFLQ